MRLMVLALFIWTAGCSDKPVIVNQREAAFYNQFVNSADRFATAEQDMPNLKLIQTGEAYAMRYLLFDNNRFYYQIDRLGTGTGTWKYTNGGLTLTATRTMFDLDIYLSAEKAEGDGLVVRFFDRHGFNSVPGQLRQPAPTEQEPLKDFTKSEKDI